MNRDRGRDGQPPRTRMAATEPLGLGRCLGISERFRISQNIWTSSNILSHGTFQMNSHSHSNRKSLLSASKSCRLGTVLILSISFFFVELISGYVLHSVAVAADAIHMLSDSGALIIAIVSVRVSSIFPTTFMSTLIRIWSRLPSANHKKTRLGKSNCILNEWWWQKVCA